MRKRLPPSDEILQGHRQRCWAVLVSLEAGVHMQGLVDAVCLLRGTHPHVEIERMDQVSVGIMDIRSKGEVRRR